MKSSILRLVYLPPAIGELPQERQVRKKMISFNQVTFAGNVGRESELQQTDNGNTYARFSLAVDSSFTKDEPPMWLTVTAWGKLAEQVSKLVKKGSLVLVSGRLAIRSYTDKESK